MSTNVIVDKVRWVGHDASGAAWERLEKLVNSKVAVAAFEQATGRSLPLCDPQAPAAAAAPPAGFIVDLAPPGKLRAALVHNPSVHRCTRKRA